MFLLIFLKWSVYMVLADEQIHISHKEYLWILSILILKTALYFSLGHLLSGVCCLLCTDIVHFQPAL